jgi:CHASE2 domain-containing sensor protein
MSNKGSGMGLLHLVTTTLRSRLPKPPATTKPAIAPDTETFATREPEEAAPTKPHPKLPKFGIPHLGHSLMLFWAVAAAGATAANLHSVQGWERRAQSLMFQVRGTVPTPDNIVILAVDDESLLQLAGSSWPLRRATYAKVIDKVMQAGAKVVAIDILWDLPSSFSPTAEATTDCTVKQQISDDDQQLANVLNRYDGRVVLAADFDALDTREGSQSLVSLPFCPFRTPNAVYGSISFPTEPDDAIHRLGSVALTENISTVEQMLLKEENVISFAEATLKAAKVEYAPPQGDQFFYYGDAGAFSGSGLTIPFLKVLSPENWNSQYLQQGKVFKDKIVLIGPTASKVGDIMNTPFGKMPGVELHANAIATLLQNRSIRPALPLNWTGFMVFLLVLGSGVFQARTKIPAARLGVGGAISFLWSIIGYLVFTEGLLILPVAIPAGAIILVGLSYFGTGLLYDHRNKSQFRKTLKHYAGSPLVQEIISQQDDLKDLLQERELEILGKKLGGRYKITKVLGSGGFGETYVAEDVQRPGQPQCVVKQLRPSTNNPKHMKLARRLFQVEAETLERLGEHDQIPRLLAYFEEDDEFYLVQQFVGGHPLSEELAIGRYLPEARIVHILQELLQILSFVHSRNVIHRDIKPSNVIKRHLDGRLVLIDFGAVKALSTIAEDDGPSTATIGIGTQGYMPPEQCAGNPRFNSDIYAVGMMGIQALTGLPPSQLKQDQQTGEIDWQAKAIVSPALAFILSKMVTYEFKNRYQSTVDVLNDLEQLSNLSTLSLPPDLLEDIELAEEDNITTTRPWPNTFESEEELPPTEPPPTDAE